MILYIICENQKTIIHANTQYLWFQNISFHSVWATTSTLYYLGITKATEYFFYNFFSNKKWYRFFSCSVHLASHCVRPWQGRCCAHSCWRTTPRRGRPPPPTPFDPPTDAATATIVASHIIFCQLFVSPSVGEICTTECHPSSWI